MSRKTPPAHPVISRRERSEEFSHEFVGRDSNLRRAFHSEQNEKDAPPTCPTAKRHGSRNLLRRPRVVMEVNGGTRHGQRSHSERSPSCWRPRRSLSYQTAFRSG